MQIERPLQTTQGTPPETEAPPTPEAADWTAVLDSLPAKNRALEQWAGTPDFVAEDL